MLHTAFCITFISVNYHDAMLDFQPNKKRAVPAGGSLALLMNQKIQCFEIYKLMTQAAAL